MNKEIKMNDVFVSESGRFIVGSVKTEIYQDIDHNMIDTIGKFQTEKHAEYAAHAIKNHDRLVEENKRLREALECIHEYASMIPLHLTDEKTHSNEHIMHFVKQIKSLSELGGE